MANGIFGSLGGRAAAPMRPQAAIRPNLMPIREFGGALGGSMFSGGGVPGVFSGLAGALPRSVSGTSGFADRLGRRLQRSIRPGGLQPIAANLLGGLGTF